MNYDEARQYIEDAGKYGMVLGLSTMQNLLARLGNPQNRLKFIHIAGTNGKGSVGAFLNEILRTAGIKTGRYISPALFSYEERIQISDEKGTEYISKWNVAKWMSAIEFAVIEMVADGLPHPTPFELETAMAFMEFEAQGCQLVLLETGLGGRLDATNVIKTGVCQIFTAISRDHMQFLGETLTEIALEKAGIIKKGVPSVSWPQEPEVKKVLLETALELDSKLIWADFDKLSIEEMTLEKTVFSYKGERFETALLGENQPGNAALAIEAAWMLEKQGYSLGKEAICEGIKKACWTGRFTVVSREPIIIIDGAHNEAAAQSLARSLKIYFPEEKLIGIVGMFKDKEYDKVLKETLPFMEKVYTLKPEGERGLPAAELSECAKKYCQRVIACQSAGEALKKAIQENENKTAIIVYGSLSFLHEITKILQYNDVRVKRSKPT